MINNNPSLLKIGLENLTINNKWHSKIGGHIGYLGHSASVDRDLNSGLSLCHQLFGKRLVKIFGPQHGFVTDVQDNMVETNHSIHPYYQLPVYSLYGETRSPTTEMLAGLDTLIVDLQDVGTRVYTYITTLSYLMEACASHNIAVVVLDRPNPVGGLLLEGPLLHPDWKSFVGHHEIPQRHGLTMGEVALYHQKFHVPQCELTVIPMTGWSRSHFWNDTGRVWVNPSPNLATAESAITFCGTVLFEGTNLSEGRGTTRSLEVVGHKDLEPHSFMEHLEPILREFEISGVRLRPTFFHPMFQKFQGHTCGGLQIHPLEAESFYSWRLGAVLLREFYHLSSLDFQWNDRPYEYEFKNLAIDYINGSPSLREWVEKRGSFSELMAIEKKGQVDYLNRREKILIYENEDEGNL